MLALTEETEGASGRSLRKLPLLAHASLSAHTPCPCPLVAYLAAMRAARASQAHDREAVA